MDKKNENKEQDILKAAEAEFMEKGFAGAKTMHIAERAGVTHAMLHYYFGTKKKLFDRVLKSKMDVLVGSVITAFAGNAGESLLERLIKGFEAHFDFVAANPRLPLFVLQELVGTDSFEEVFFGTVKNLGKTVLPAIDKEIQEKVAAGEFRPVRAIDLLFDAVSLNIFPIVALPLMAPAYREFGYGDKEQLLADRKAEINRVLRARLLVNC